MSLFGVSRQVPAAIYIWFFGPQAKQEEGFAEPRGYQKSHAEEEQGEGLAEHRDCQNLLYWGATLFGQTHSVLTRKNSGSINWKISTSDG